MRSSLEPLQKLTHLRVIFHCNIYYPSSQPQPIESSVFTHALCNSDIDLKGCATSLVPLLPALRYVFLTTSATFGSNRKVMERWQVDGAWRVAEPSGDDTGEMPDHDGKRLLVNLADTVAATVIMEEELVLLTSTGSTHLNVVRSRPVLKLPVRLMLPVLFPTASLTLTMLVSPALSVSPVTART